MSTPPDFSMAHCVSADLQMSGAITPAFKKLCRGFEDLKKQGAETLVVFQCYFMGNSSQQKYKSLKLNTDKTKLIQVSVAR